MKNSLKIKNKTLWLVADSWDSTLLMLANVQRLCKDNDLEWIDVEIGNYTIMVEEGSDINALAAEYENWILCKQK